MKRNGFTLIELLMVVAIVGIMVVTAGPAVRKWSGRDTYIDVRTAPAQSTGSTVCVHGVLHARDGDTLVRVKANNRDVPC